MPTGKTIDSKSAVASIDIKNEEMLNMDDDKLKLVWKRMQNMALNTKSDKISRRDFLERIFLEPELKEF